MLDLIWLRRSCLYVTSTNGLDDSLPQTFLRQLVQTSAAPLPPPHHQHPSAAPLAPDPIQNTVWNLTHILTLPSESPLPSAAILTPERRNVLELSLTWPLVHPNGLALIPHWDRTFPNVPTHADYFTIAFKCFGVCFLFSVCNSVIDFPLLHILLESWQTYSIANRRLEFINAVLVQRCAVWWFSAPPIPRCP